MSKQFFFLHHSYFVFQGSLFMTQSYLFNVVSHLSPEACAITSQYPTNCSSTVKSWSCCFYLGMEGLVWSLEAQLGKKCQQPLTIAGCLGQNF